MAEDNMEISYDEHGDDDIDINIDIDQENQDDDYMIEDAHSEAGTNDDVMQDEDNASFAMEDDDYMPDHTLEDGQAEIIEVTEVEMARTAVLNPSADNPFVPLSVPEEARVPEVQEAQGSQPLEAAVEEGTNTPEQPSLPVTVLGSHVDPVAEATASPNKSAEPLHTDVAPPSPPKSIQQDHAHDINETLDPSPIQRQELLSEERTVIVQYNDTEYALVSSSESDDPDSYFLKDSHVLEEPLSIFFAVVREILGDEVGPQDELCLSIDDMGLETFETCLSNNDITLQELVDVHTTLSRNDGQTEMPPLYINLNTKPEFSRSFAKIAEDAKSGHGLNEIMEWHGDDGTEVWAESEHGFEDENSGGDDDGERENYEEAHIVHSEQLEGEEESYAAEAAATEEDVPEHVVEQNDDEVEQVAIGDGQHPTSGEQPGDDQAAQESATVQQGNAAQGTETEKLAAKNENGHDEEGDLIDYEDDDYAPSMIQSKAASRRASNSEEDLSSPCLKPASCFCSSCNERLLAEYKAINEKLDRSRRSSRSSSQTVEDPSGENNIKAAPEGDEITSAGANQPEQNVLEAANIAEPEQVESYDGEYIEEGQEEFEHETYEEVDETAHEQAEDNQYPHDDYTNFEEEPREIENQPGEEQNNHQDATTDAPDVVEQPDLRAPANDEDEISYEDDDEEAPEAAGMPALAADTNEHENIVGNSTPGDVDEDEIDYDDDDRAEAHTLDSASVATITQVASGKRPLDEPDALDLSGQESKRVRA